MPPDVVGRLNDALGGRYRVVREIGRGGMATVYLAEDPKHHRNVAVKVLREDLTVSVGGTRFLREIEIAAQLQHPNILPLLDSGEASGLLYYVMPFVEGQSLRQRLAHERELPIGEAVRLFAELVDALSYAHSRGVVHRDIKPDNIMLSGRHALITDFGVARALSAASGGDNVTSMGVALGTPAYMAPEQATADPNVDHRADIYSAGVVAYELLAGRTPFQSSTPQQMLAAQVTETPDPVAKHRPGVSPQLESLVMRCLAKRPADRWQTSGELLAALEPIATPSGGTQPTSARMPAASVPARRSRMLIGVGIAAIVAGGVWMLARPAAPSYVLGKTTQLTSETGLEIHPAISPDGKFVAYAAGTAERLRIYIRPVGGGRTITLTDDSVAGEWQPKWSPDQSQILFLTRGGVSVTSPLGGAMRPVVPPSALSPVSSATWSPDGKEIAVGRGDSLLISPVAGGAPRLVGTMQPNQSPGGCDWSRDGRWIACVEGNSFYSRPGERFGNTARSVIRVFPAVGGSSIVVSEDSMKLNQSPIWSPNSDELFYISNRDGARDLFVRRIGRDGNARSPAVRLTTGANAHSLSMTADGQRLAYSVFTSEANLWAIGIPSGSPVTADAAEQITSSNQTIESVMASKDGKWIVYDSDINGPAAIFRVSTSGGTSERLAADSVDFFAGDLSLDGRELAYHSWRNGTRDIEVKALDGSAPVAVTSTTTAQERFPVWSPEGNALAFFDEGRPGGVFVVRRDRTSGWGRPVRVGTGMGIRWMPDGRIVYVADSSQGGPNNQNAHRAIVIADADGKAQRTVYVGGPGRPIPGRIEASPDGRTIYFKTLNARKGAEIWGVPASGGAPRLLVSFYNPARPSVRSDFTGDGKRFYFRIEDRQSDIWVADLQKK